MSEAEISISSWRRKAKASSATKAPARPNAAIHQMCQIRAKPVTTAKKALTKPIGLFLGISIGSYASAGTATPCVACMAFLVLHQASISLTCGMIAKFQAGGGEGNDHSSVRPFHGSPV